MFTRWWFSGPSPETGAQTADCHTGETTQSYSSIGLMTGLCRGPGPAESRSSPFAESVYITLSADLPRTASNRDSAEFEASIHLVGTVSIEKSFIVLISQFFHFRICLCSPWPFCSLRLQMHP
jgi:hypothetical protein